MEIEKDIEKYLKRKVEQHGGLCFKFVSPGQAGVPDRIVIMNGTTLFVEMKRPGGKPRILQRRIIKKMQDHGARVEVVDTKEQVERLVRELEGRVT